MELKNLPYWLKLGSIFLIVSLASYSIVTLCVYVLDGSEVCLVYGIPLLAGVLLNWTKAGSIKLLQGVFINSLFGMFIGFIIDKIKSKKKIKYPLCLY